MVKHSLQAGVTLIEMIVVVAIIAVVSSVIIFNYSDFSNNVSLRNLSQEVALSVRKAQTYATSVRPIEGLSGVTSRAFAGYGISFNLDNAVGQSPTSATAKTFVLFADIPDDAGTVDGTYNQTSTTCGTLSQSDECIETFGITTADKIVGICADGPAGTGSYDGSSNSPLGCEHGSVDITFVRPNPDAHILYHNGATQGTASYAKIIFESAKGLYRSVTVWNTGQISVQ